MQGLLVPLGSDILLSKGNSKHDNDINYHSWFTKVLCN